MTPETSGRPDENRDEEPDEAPRREGYVAAAGLDRSELFIQRTIFQLTSNEIPGQLSVAVTASGGFFENV